MKALKLMILGFMLVATGFGATAAWIKYNHKQQSIDNMTVAGGMTPHKLDNGTIIFENSPTTTLQDIAPAAGGSAGDQPVFQYNPLTQTYRAIGRKDILNTAPKQ